MIVIVLVAVGFLLQELAVIRIRRRVGESELAVARIRQQIEELYQQMTTTSNCSVENDFATCSVEDVVDTSDAWHIFGTECPKGEIVFLCQVVVLYTVIVVSIYNLTIGHGDSTLWTALLSSSLGYLLPNPSMKRDDGI